jgi:23S rRNA (cytidine1920-2'-O)/16S rRNA (cytidine1409-2'-O)-methyltransferase
VVRVGGATAAKPATQVDEAAAVTVAPADAGPEWVSRGAHKLLGALAAFDHDGHLVTGRQALDAGASTGGFTEVLLHAGAAHVVAVDVGYGQLAWSLRSDPRVTVLDRTNVRSLELAALPYRPEVVVADLSFISLRLVLPALAGVVAPGADLLLMVKPQFEVGRAVLEQAGSGGVVRDPAVRAGAVLDVAAAAWALGLGTAGVVASPLPGPSGNVEYFLHLRADAGPPDAGSVDRAVAPGPP